MPLMIVILLASTAFLGITVKEEYFPDPVAPTPVVISEPAPITAPTQPTVQKKQIQKKVIKEDITTKIDFDEIKREAESKARADIKPIKLPEINHEPLKFKKIELHNDPVNYGTSVDSSYDKAMKKKACSVPALQKPSFCY